MGDVEIRMHQGRTFTVSGTILDASGAPAVRLVADIADLRGQAAGRDAPAVEILLSNRGAVVTGRAVDDSGNSVPRAQVLMLRVGKDGFPMLLSASTRTAAAGTFRLGPARDGEYALVALPAESEYPQPGEWERLARLAARGERVTLGELDERMVDLQVVTTDRR